MKGFAIVRINAGAPDIGALPCKGWVLCGQLANDWGAYIFSGTGAELTAINALPQAYGICTFSGGKPELAPELDAVISAPARTRINGWLVDRGYPTIPAGWTYRQVILAVFRRLHAVYELAENDIED